MAGLLVPAVGLLLTPLIVAPAVITAYSLAVRPERRAVGAMVLTSAALLIASTPLGKLPPWCLLGAVVAAAEWCQVALAGGSAGIRFPGDDVVEVAAL